MRRLTQDEVCKRLKEKQFTLLSEYKNTRTKIRVRCDVCNYEYDVAPNTLINTPYGCPSCAGVLKKTTEIFIEELKNINPNIEVLGEYVNNKTKIKCRCIIDNHIWHPFPQGLLVGEGCPKCKGRGVTERLSKSHEDFVKDLYLINQNIKPLEKYINGKTKILFKCLKCNYEWKTQPCGLMQGNGCPSCSNNIRLTNYEFHELAKKNNPYITVLDEYKSNKINLKCVCNDCSKEFYTSSKSILKGIKCPLCRDAKIRTHDEFVEEMKIINPKYKILGKFINTSTKIKVECLDCGNICDISPKGLLKGNGCRLCYERNCGGENHPNWNPNITDEERIIGRRYPEYKEWVKSVYERDNWTCQVTGEYGHGNLVAHHLDGYNWCKEKRVNIKNGITLSDKIHKEFHFIYGKGNNTTNQFIEFITNKYKNNQMSENRYLNLMKILENNLEE